MLTPRDVWCWSRRRRWVAALCLWFFSNRVQQSVSSRVEGSRSKRKPRQSSLSALLGLGRLLPSPQGCLELGDHGGIWARATLEADQSWLAAAEEHGAVWVIYGVRVGVRSPEWAESYTDEDRDAELFDSRTRGLVAIAEVPWMNAQ